MSDQATDEGPKEIDEYRLIRRLGSGAMGVVYLAHDRLLDRAVAVKFISQEAPDAHTRSRFLVEARAAARLQHPNVISVFRVAVLEGRPFIVSEYLRGPGRFTAVSRVAAHLDLDMARIAAFGPALREHEQAKI